MDVRFYSLASILAMEALHLVHNRNDAKGALQLAVLANAIAGEENQ